MTRNKTTSEIVEAIGEIDGCRYVFESPSNISEILLRVDDSHKDDLISVLRNSNAVIVDEDQRNSPDTYDAHLHIRTNSDDNAFSGEIF